MKESIAEALHCLEVDPFSHVLRTHQVIAHYDAKPALSSFITRDMRLLWRFHETEIQVINIIDIGGHSGGEKVYR